VSLPKLIEVCRNCHARQARLMGVVGGRIVDALRQVHVGSQVLSLKSLEVNPCNLNLKSMKVGTIPLHMGSQILSPNYDMDVYMTTFFGGEAWDLCGELGQVKS
jgi:hypothetical protein